MTELSVLSLTGHLYLSLIPLVLLQRYLFPPSAATPVPLATGAGNSIRQAGHGTPTATYNFRQGPPTFLQSPTTAIQKELKDSVPTQPTGAPRLYEGPVKEAGGGGTERGRATRG
ncbi:hypothetical protein NFI96_012365, partial [Prochilodus magdalenae]